MMKKLFSANPAHIGRPDGPPMPDALPESLLHGTPRALRKDLETVAALTEESLDNAQKQLVRLASYTTTR